MNLVEKALVFATKAHEGQMRRLMNIPLILHPMEVATIICTITNDHEIIAAGILHDTVEDCDVDPEEIRKEFGDRVCKLVAGETEPKFPDLTPEESWYQRKKISLEELKVSNKDVKIMWLADKLSNARSYYREYNKAGFEFVKHLHVQDLKLQKWYYYTIAEYLSELSDTFAYKEYVEKIQTVFGSIEDLER